MRAVFRADASNRIGAGHISRCLALADELAGRGVSVRFLCRDLPGHAGMSLSRSGYRLDWLPALPDSDHASGQEEDANASARFLDRKDPPDWLIVDHYCLDAPWEQAMRPYARHVMAIDDLANRAHACDVLLDHNFVADYEHRYAAYVPDHCLCLLGPRYALLRSEFDAARAHRSPLLATPRRLLVSFGGSDPTGETEKTLHALLKLARPDLVSDVIVGEQNPRSEAIRALAQRVPGAMVHLQPKNMAEVVAEADLAIGACGVSALERCYLGVPQLVIVVVDNQVASALALAEIGAVVSIGHSREVDADAIAAALSGVLDHPEWRARIVSGCQELFPAQAPPGRQLIVDRMLALA